MFATAVFVQVMCWVFGPAEKLPPAVAEAMTMSGACVRAVICARGCVWVFQTVLVCRRRETGLNALTSSCCPEHFAPTRTTIHHRLSHR